MRHWFFLSLVIIASQSCFTTKPVNKVQLTVKTITIIECQSPNAVKIGDTLLLSDARAGDTLAISFSVNSGTGLGWDFEPANDSIVQFVNKTVTEVPLGENGGRRIFNYYMVIKKQNECFLNFWLQRRAGSTRYGHCCINVFFSLNIN